MSLTNSDQFLCHCLGDYVLQSDWMANNKTKSSIAAATHALTYTLPFLVLTRSPKRLGLIAGTHFLIDRFKLARYVVWAKNQPAPMEDRSLTSTGMPPTTPPFLAVWIQIIVDNIMHVILNALFLRKN